MRNIQLNISGPMEIIKKENNAAYKPVLDGKSLSEQLTEQMRLEMLGKSVDKQIRAGVSKLPS